jgi:hypothetical protein
LRHGLAIPARLDSALSQEIEELAELIAGRNVAPYLLDCSQRVAEAQIDLRRIRRGRLSAWSKVETGELRGAAAPKISQASLGGPAELNTFAKQLLRLDRYERRALSRRKAGIREFESICSASKPVCSSKTDRSYNLIASVVLHRSSFWQNKANSG